MGTLLNTKALRQMVVCALASYCFFGGNNLSGLLPGGLPAAEARPRFPVLPTDDAKRVLQAHLAGLSGDATQIPAIMDLLRRPVHPTMHETAMLALARLGAVQAVPLFDTLSQDKNNSDVAHFALVARARLVAEGQTQALAPGPSRAAAKVSRFYQELNLSPQDLNAALVDYQQNYSGKLHVTLPAATEVGQDAVEQLADMAYHDLSTNYVSLPGIAAVNFSADPPAALKMRLAPLPRPERIAAMIYDLTHRTRTVWSAVDNDEVQLLDDEGLDASHAVADQLKTMEQHQGEYKSTAFGAMFSVLSNVGDKEQAPLMYHFKSNHDPVIAEYADRLYDSIAKGNQTQIVSGY